MRRSRVLYGTFVSAAFSVYATTGAHADDATANQKEPCVSLIRTLAGQIETIKQLTLHPTTFVQHEQKKKSKSHDKHGLDVELNFPDNAQAANAARQAAARERQQADSLNGMLPGFGCSPLDIDAELKKPERPDLLPKPSGTSKKTSQ